MDRLPPGQTAVLHLAQSPPPTPQAITRAYPDHGILGEEGGVMGDVTSDYLWCVDPLDGTTNFAHGYPSFAVSVGVLRHAVPVAGVVIEFTGGPGGWITRTYEAARDMGATCDGRPISVSRVKVLEQSLLVSVLVFGAKKGERPQLGAALAAG